MHWWYKLIEKDSDKYVYAYSCESKEYDGRIVYSIKSRMAIMEKPSKTDEGVDLFERRGLEHFFILVREEFPEERHVCCG